MFEGYKQTAALSCTNSELVEKKRNQELQCLPNAMFRNKFNQGSQSLYDYSYKILMKEIIEDI